MKKILARWLPFIFWASWIFFMSSLPAIQVAHEKTLDFVIHKIAHVLEYTLLFILSYRAFGKKGWTAFIFTVFYAATDELHQLFVPTREGRIRDIFFDTTGAFTGWILIWKLQAFLPNRLKHWLSI